jgi:Suppressor of fused protein (SUFU)
MAVYFLMYHVKPEQDNPRASEVVGAYVNCWVISDTIEEAVEIAIPKITGLKWIIAYLEEGYEVTESDYIDNTNGLELYKQALIDKEVYNVHMYETVDEIPTKSFSQEEYEKDYELKENALEHVLGKMAAVVGHALIPFDIGDAVDMYYFPNHIAGTGFATMELIDPEGNGPKPNNYGTYELVAFTKLSSTEDDDDDSPFNVIQSRICGIFTETGKYSFDAVLKPGDTCGIPSDNDENRCLILDNYRPDGRDFNVGERKHHLLLCIEIFRSEMEFAMENGSARLFELLKLKGYYPYSDLDREAVS